MPAGKGFDGFVRVYHSMRIPADGHAMLTLTDLHQASCTSPPDQGCTYCMIYLHNHHQQFAGSYICSTGAPAGPPHAQHGQDCFGCWHCQAAAIFINTAEASFSADAQSPTQSPTAMPSVLQVPLLPHKDKLFANGKMLHLDRIWICSLSYPT